MSKHKFLPVKTVSNKTAFIKIKYIAAASEIDNNTCLIILNDGTKFEVKIKLQQLIEYIN